MRPPSASERSVVSVAVADVLVVEGTTGAFASSRNSFTPCPSDFAISGSLPAPKMIMMITRTMTSSCQPSPAMKVLPTWGVVANGRPRDPASPGVHRCFYHESGHSRRYGVISTRIPTGAHWYIHRQIDAAVAHRGAEVIVPICAMERVAAIGEIHHVRHIRHVVVLPS